MAQFFYTFLYDPLYNGLIFLVNILPGADLGFGVIMLTIIVKTALLPLSHKSSKIQAKMREIEPHVKALQEKHKDNKEELMKKTMELYKEKGTTPFSGCLPLFIQIPIIMALYWVFFKGLAFSADAIAALPQLVGHINGTLLNNEHLYSFITVPEFLRTNFLGLIDLTGKSLVLAIIAGASQYYQIKMTLPAAAKTGPSTNTKEEFAKAMQVQMRYVMPVIVFVFAYTISAAIALYWATSNIYTILQEMFTKRTLRASEVKTTS